MGGGFRSSGSPSSFGSHSSSSSHSSFGSSGSRSSSGWSSSGSRSYGGTRYVPVPVGSGYYRYGNTYGYQTGASTAVWWTLLFLIAVVVAVAVFGWWLGRRRRREAEVAQQGRREQVAHLRALHGIERLRRQVAEAALLQALGRGIHGRQCVFHLLRVRGIRAQRVCMKFG